MWVSRPGHRRCKLAVSVLLLHTLIGVPYGTCSAHDEGHGDDWHPASKFEGKFDWIQMKSLEWVKGEFIAMYDEGVEFDSDEFDELTLDLEDIKQIRTSRVVSVGLLHHASAVGTLFADGDRVLVIDGDDVREFTRADVVTITAGAPKEINFWSFKAFFGLIVREGNSEVRETNVQINIKRRSIGNRVTIDIIGNENMTDDAAISDNQRATAGWDRFVNARVFVQPIYGEYFRDPFQNIGRRLTAGVGAGYQLMDSPKVDWELSGGPAYQETRFADVVPGTTEEENTLALIFSTAFDWDINKKLDFNGEYRLQIVNQESGGFNHHLLLSLETDITKFIDFDIGWVWDRIQKPRPDSNGIVPQQNDFRTTVGLTFDF